MKPKMYLLKIIALALTTLTLFKCDPADNRLKIVNNSNKDIYFYYSCDSSLIDFKIFRTGYYKNNLGDSAFTKADYFIKSDNSINVMRRGFNAWNNYLKKCTGQTLYVSFVTDSIVSNYTDTEIVELGLINKQISLSRIELKENGWIINYY